MASGKKVILLPEQVREMVDVISSIAHDDDFHKIAHEFAEGSEKNCIVCKAKRCLEYLESGRRE